MYVSLFVMLTVLITNVLGPSRLLYKKPVGAVMSTCSNFCSGRPIRICKLSQMYVFLRKRRCRERYHKNIYVYFLNLLQECSLLQVVCSQGKLQTAAVLIKEFGVDPNSRDGDVRA